MRQAVVPALAMPLLFLLLLALALPAAAQFAAPRPEAVVEGPEVRLSHLFSGIPPARDPVLGPAPPPGQRIVIEAPQLAVIARQAGLAWRPSGTERVVLERPGRALDRAEVEAALRAALEPLGLDPQAELELPPGALPAVPPAASLRLLVEQPAFDAASGRFSATLLVLADGAPPERLRLAGRAAVMVPVVVAVRRIPAGRPIGAADLREERWRAERVRPGMAASLAEVAGRQSRRPIGEGQPVVLSDLAAASVISRNETVTVEVEQGALALTLRGRALADAALGEAVPVMNPSSRAVIETIAIGPGRVRAAFGAAPVATVPDTQSPTAAIAARLANR
ncbi:MAG: flagellar basal body P-ring formation chaperone FlgA [Acetobacteraceae bacterium]|nr:flagellar basal body P-ring formation chaperone FlgA [Acetobacteraceae bacterium]MCX7685982.1 flagellar basal body P-ring formation chaperone FlgA [Acetobacteraceae bacterium]MDW8397517.1 flagellar basal body P-ring formation chaperone FlgA [Acetobacteraceae bacterium]